MMLKTLTAAALAVTTLAATPAPAQSEGSYIVPATPDMPEPVELALERARLDEHGDRVRLEYRLPKELDGAEPQGFRLEGPAASGSTVALYADGVTATCTVAPDDLSCVMRYGAGFTLNAAASDEYLATAGLPDAEIARLKQARDVLEHQAVGIVRIKRR